MSPLNWYKSSPLRKNHVQVCVSHATPMLPMPSRESLFSNLNNLLLYTLTLLLAQIQGPNLNQGPIHDPNKMS